MHDTRRSAGSNSTLPLRIFSLLLIAGLLTTPTADAARGEKAEARPGVGLQGLQQRQDAGLRHHVLGPEGMGQPLPVAVEGPWTLLLDLGVGEAGPRHELPNDLGIRLPRVVVRRRATHGAEDLLEGSLERALGDRAG